MNNRVDVLVGLRSALRQISAAVVGLCVCAFATGALAADQPPVPIAPRVPLEAVPIDARIKVPAGPGWLGVGFGSVWISKSKSRAVYRIDPSSNKVIAKIPVGPDAELGVVTALGSVWIPDTKDHSLTQIDPARNAVVHKFPLEISDDPEGSIAVVGDGAWFVSNRGGTDAGTLVRVDLATGRRATELAIPPQSHAVEAAFGAIWVTSSGAGLVVRVDPVTNEVVARIPVHEGPRFMVAGFGSLWVLSQSDGTLARIDPQTNQVIATLELHVPGPGGDLAIDATRVWVSAEGTPISLVDPTTNTVRVQVVGGHELDTLRAAFGAIWLLDEHNGVLRIDPAKLLSTLH
jgi:virginiamycin B lyase